MRVGFPQNVRDYLIGIVPFQGIVWQHQGEPRIVLKLPEDVNFHSMPVVVTELEQDTLSAFHLTLQFSREDYPAASIVCLINPAALPDPHVLHALLSVQQMEVYAVGPNLSYLGIQSVAWSQEHRRRLILLARDLLAREMTVELVGKEQLSLQSLSALHATYRQTLRHIHHLERVNHRIQ